MSDVPAWLPRFRARLARALGPDYTVELFGTTLHVIARATHLDGAPCEIWGVPGYLRWDLSDRGTTWAHTQAVRGSPPDPDDWAAYAALSGLGSTPDHHLVIRLVGGSVPTLPDHLASLIHRFTRAMIVLPRRCRSAPTPEEPSSQS